jgi:hypothetical protein
MKSLLAALLVLFSLSAYGYDLTAELNKGHAGEQQLRVGPDFKLSDHWSLDTGVSFIEYHNFGGNVESLDGVVTHRSTWGNKYLDVGTGLAIWTKKDWDVQKSETQWTFSNRVGAGFKLSKTSEVGVVWRHYSNLCYHPNTSKDFVGAHFALHF